MPISDSVVRSSPATSPVHAVRGRGPFREQVPALRRLPRKSSLEYAAKPALPAAAAATRPEVRRPKPLLPPDPTTAPCRESGRGRRRLVRVACGGTLDGPATDTVARRSCKPKATIFPNSSVGSIARGPPRAHPARRLRRRPGSTKTDTPDGTVYRGRMATKEPVVPSRRPAPRGSHRVSPCHSFHSRPRSAAKTGPIGVPHLLDARPGRSVYN